MKFATLGHLMVEENLAQMPTEWIHNSWIYSPEISLPGAKGHITGLTLTAKEIMAMPIEKVRKKILDLALFLQDELQVDLIQLGALTTSVTSGGMWLAENPSYNGYVNHGDSYTVAVACQNVLKSLQRREKEAKNCHLAIIGAYGIIGEATSQLLAPLFRKTTLIGRDEKKLHSLKDKINANVTTTSKLQTKSADVIVTATSHPTALLTSNHLKKNVIVVDVSQPPNLSYEVWEKRTDVFRVDGGFVDLPSIYPYQIPGLPLGKIFSCVAEVMMQAMEKDKHDYVGSIDLTHVKKTEQWGKKYHLTLRELTNFGMSFNRR